MRKIFPPSNACMRAIFSLGLSGTLLLASCIAMAQPTFTGGRYQTTHACGSSTLDLTTLLSVSDPVTASALTWSVINSPLGAVTSTASGISGGGSVSPSLFTYTAVAGVTTDVVSVVVSDGTNVDTTEITIAVNAPLAASFSYSGAYSTFWWSDTDFYVCPGAYDTLHLNADPGTIAVVRKLNMASLAATYDTITIPASGSYGFFTGAITDSIRYSVLSLTNGVCDNFSMDASSVTFRVSAPASILGKYLTGPGSTGEMDGPLLLPSDSASICAGTSRQLTLNVNNAIYSGSLYNATSTAPVIMYRINGGAPQNLLMGSMPPDFTELVTVGPVSGNIDYEFTQITTYAGCVFPISERLHITEVTNPSATMSVTGSVCSGDSAIITVNGTPNQRFLLFKNDAGDVYQTDGMGMFNMSSGPLSANTTYVLYDGFDILDATCLTDYYDTIVVQVNHAPTGIAITSPAAVCLGGSFTLSANNPGGLWTATNSNATIAGNVVTGVNAGVDTLTYVVTNSCGADTAVQILTIIPDLSGAVTISAADENICPGSVTTINLDGPAGAFVTYNQHFEQYVAEGIISDTAFSVTLDASGHASILLNAADPNTGGQELAAAQNYTYTVTSVSLSGCAATDLVSGTTVINANYIYAYIDGTGPRFEGLTHLIPDSIASFVCQGLLDTIHIAAPVGSIAVIKKEVPGTSFVSYDTVTIPASGVYQLPTGPIMNNVVYSVVAISHDGCERFVMDKYYTSYKVFASSTISSFNITGPANPDDLLDIYPANSAGVCVGTYRNLLIQVNSNPYLTNDLNPMNTSTVMPSLYYSVNGGPTQMAELTNFDLPNVAAVINTGVMTGDQLYTFTQITNDAGCVMPIDDSIFIAGVHFPTANLSVTGALCSGDSSQITITGTPNQQFLLYKNDIASIYQTDGTGSFIMSSGPLSSTTTFVLSDGFDLRDATCLTYYHDTAVVQVGHTPLGTAITSPAAVCLGGSFTLSANNPGGLWTATNSNATIVGNVITGVNAGVDTLTYVVANSCGADTAFQILTIIPDLSGAVTISPAITDVCPGSSTAVTIEGPAGAVVTYQYEFQDVIAAGGGIVDSVFTTTLDATGHSVLPVITTDIHSGEIATSNSVRYYYTLMSASLGGCAASYTAAEAAMVSANYTSGYWQNTGRTFVADESDYLYVCPGTEDTLRLSIASDATAVVKITNLRTLAVSYDTVTMSHEGFYDIYTGPITDSVSYTVVAMDNAGCNKIVMNNYTVKFKPFPPATLTGRYISAAPYDDADLISIDTAHACIGTFRELKLGIDNAVWSYLSTSSTPVNVMFRVNGGAIQTVNGDALDPNMTEFIFTGILTADQHYQFVGITNSAGCVTPIDDSAYLPIVNFPTASLSATGPLCSGESSLVTVMGTPNQQFLLYKNDTGFIYQTDAAGTFSISSGPLSNNMTFVLSDGFDMRDALCLSYYHDTVNITVDHALTGTAITSSAAVCVGNNITLSANNAGGIWTLMNGHATISGDIVTGVSAGVDTLIYLVTNSCGTDTAIQLFTINALPYAGALTGADSVCKNSLTLLLPSVAGGIWSVASSAIATVDGSGHVTGLAAGTTTVSYAVTTGSCGSAYAQHNIVVNSLPDAGVVVGADSVCFGLSVTLSNSVAGGTWSSASANVDVNALTGEVTGMLAGNATVTYTAHTYSCGDANETHSIFVKSLPDAGAISGADSICTGSATTLFNTVAGVWSSSDNTVAIVNASGLVSAVSSGNATITFTNTVFGCSSAFVTHDVVVNVLPDAGTITGLSSICVGGSVPLADTIIGGTWSSSDNAIATISGDILSGVAAGSVAISYTVSNICGSSTTTMSLAVVPSPVPVINPGTGNTLYTGSFASYQWYRNGVMITGATSGICDASIPGVYTVIVTDGNGCTGSATYNNSVGIHDVNSIVEVHIYPNPASGVLNIDAPMTVNVKVLTVDGKIAAEATGEKRVDISNLSAGIYMVMVYNAEGVLLKIEKIVKAD